MRRFFWLIFILLLAACNFPPGKTLAPTLTPGVDTVATAVAQKLTAVALETSTIPPASTETPLPAPTSTPKTTDLIVVYVKSGNLWLWDGIEPVQLTNSGQDARPKISDDGRVVAFVRNGDLWAINADGSNEHVLASQSDLEKFPYSVDGKPEVSQFVFVPGGHDVYFNTAMTGENYFIPQYNLAKVNVDRPSVHLLLKNDAGDAIVFSPDGSKIALIQPEKINMINADGSGFKTLFTFKMVSTYSEWNYLPAIVWMPDSSGFKTVIPASDPLGNPQELTRFYFISTTGRKPAKLAEFLAAPAFQTEAFISPDGTKVVYAKPQGGNLELHVIDASTADKMFFWQPRDKFGVRGWTLDSQGILYWRDDTRHAWLYTADGQSVPLSDVTYAAFVTWVDKNRYLFVNETELRLRTLNQPSLLIDAEASGTFDFSLSAP